MSKKGMKRLDHSRLAEGEVTGHYHEAVGEGISLWGSDGVPAVLDAPRGASIRHQEHHEFDIRPNEYDRVIVREYDHFAEEAREVID